MVMLLLGTLGLVAFGAISWIVLLASVAALQAEFSEYSDVSETLGTSSFTDWDVSNLLGLPWWMVWYHFALLIAVTVIAALGVLKQYAQLLGHFLAALFALQMINTHSAAALARTPEDSYASYESKVRAHLAGCIMCALSTGALIIWLGMLPTFSNDTVSKAPQTNQKNGIMHGSYAAPMPPVSGAAAYGAPGVPTPQNQQYSVPPPQNQQYSVPPPQNQQYSVPPAQNQQYSVPPAQNQQSQQYSAANATGSSYGTAPPAVHEAAQPLGPIPRENGYGNAPQAGRPPPPGATYFAPQQSQ